MIKAMAELNTRKQNGGVKEFLAAVADQSVLEVVLKRGNQVTSDGQA